MCGTSDMSVRSTSRLFTEMIFIFRCRRILVMTVTSVYGAVFHVACLAYFAHNRDQFDDRCAWIVWSTANVNSVMVLTVTSVYFAEFHVACLA
jgi:hypothetical protein